MSKILLLDIETAPSTAYIWSLWTEPRSMSCVERDWFILCWCAKWLDNKKVMSSALPDFKTYKKEPENDKYILKVLWKLLNEADIVIAHNGIKFDIKKINTRFVMNGILPPSPYKVIDTLRIARSSFSFMSNKLNDLCQMLNVGEKYPTGGFQLWKDCLAGQAKAWRTMVTYCKQDIKLLEKVYLKLRPYAKRLANIAVYDNQNELACTKCGSTNVYMRGYYFTQACKFRRYSCKDCGSWSRGRKQVQNNTTLANTV